MKLQIMSKLKKTLHKFEQPQPPLTQVQMNCPFCKTNLDEGDIFEHFMLKYNNREKALSSAKSYGWSETNKVRFNRSVIVQPDRSPQYTICPDCKKVLPPSDAH